MATPIIAAPTTTDNSEKKSERSVEAAVVKNNMRSQKYYSPLVDLLSPSPWDLNVPGGPEDMAQIIYLRSPRQAHLEDSDEDLETAEQILFRPLFRHRQLIAERVQRLREKEALRRRFFSAEASKQFSSNALDDGFFNNRQERSVLPLSYQEFDNPKYYFKQ